MKSLVVSAAEARKELKAMGSKVSLSLKSENFPHVVDEGYQPVWDEFLTTRAVKEMKTLFKSFGPEVVQLFICQAFISHLHTISSNFLKKPYKVSQSSAVLLTQLFKNISDLIDKDLHKLTIDKRLVIGTVDVVMEGKEDKFLNALIEPDITIFISLVAKSKRAIIKSDGKNKSILETLDRIIYSMSGYLYRGTTPPPQLLGRKSGTRTSYNSVEVSKLARPFRWLYLKNTVLGLEIIRADRDILLLKVKLPTHVGLYLGTNSKKKVITTVVKAIKTQLGAY